MSALTLIIAGVTGYLIGSIPTGYLVVNALTGRDVTTVGSGRTGGTNALRAGGMRAFVLTGVGDFLKGVAAVLVADLIARRMGGDVPLARAVAGLAAVAGHNWSVYLGFKGGAGTGPNIGASVAMWPLSFLWLVPLVPIGVFVLGYASVTSLIIAILIPIGLAVHALTGHGSWYYVLYGIATAVAVAWALRPNIKRLLAGTEPRVGRSPSKPL